jgi:hypothetical protein
MLAEDHVPGGDVGPTIRAVLADQFTRLRDGDRFFYLNENYNRDEMNLIRQGDTLTQVIQQNTNITNLQGDAFYFKVSISGSVYSDQERGHRRGVAGLTVQLLDTSGDVLATTTTDSQGRYSFTDQTGIPGTGQFTVALDLPSKMTQITPDPGTIVISRGSTDVSGIDFHVVSRGNGGFGPAALFATGQSREWTAAGAVEPNAVPVTAVTAASLPESQPAPLQSAAQSALLSQATKSLAEGVIEVGETSSADHPDNPAKEFAGLELSL